MNVAILGTGYVGLVSGVCLAAKGHHITCLDLRHEVVEKLNRGEPHIHESGLADLLKQTRAAGRFAAALPTPAAMETAEVILVAVGTPSVEGRIDFGQIRSACEFIGEFLKTALRHVSVVVKSTVLPGTTDTLVLGCLEERSGRKLGQFGLGMNPEFLREGKAVEDFMNADRIVLGHEDEQTLERLQELYAPWPCEKLAVNSRTAEMIKYASNCLLATQISAVNELANLSFELGNIDVRDVMRGVHLDQRWNPIGPGRQRASPEILTYLIPGCGFGGSCFPKDVQAIRSLGRDHGLPMEMLEAVLAVNDSQPLQIIRQLESALGSLRGQRILLLGLAFKPGTDDVRESASIRIAQELLVQGARVSAHDPVALANARAVFPPEAAIDWLSGDWQPALRNADAVVVATGWPEYEDLRDPNIAAILRGKPLVDARRMFQPEEFPDTIYLTIGRRMASSL